ncbi:MAG: GNAT family N-acetyltransferase [Planctomycetota bacterium]
MEISTYEIADKKDWDGFVNRSKQGTFLFLRDYMEYHADRFEDHSVVVRDKDNKTIALLPANRDDDILVSHAGLTYGGFLTDEGMTIARMMDIFHIVSQHLKTQGFSRLLYKTIPSIYHSLPAQEDRYCLFRMGATVHRRDVLSVIDYRQRLPYKERRKRALRKAGNNILSIKETEDYARFWAILTENLLKKHGLKPVHTLDEMERLAKAFPKEIKLFASYSENDMLAGAVAYLSPNVCHIQYNAATDDGKRIGAQDIILDYMIEYYSKTKRFFDFGVSTEDDARHLNIGLVEYKEGFGARTVIHDFYEIDLSRINGEP